MAYVVPSQRQFEMRPISFMQSTLWNKERKEKSLLLQERIQAFDQCRQRRQDICTWRRRHAQHGAALYIFNKQITSTSAFVMLTGNSQQFFHQHLRSVGFCVLTSFPLGELPCIHK